MFERFTEEARRALGHSRQVAQEWNHHEIGPEQFLLGMLRDLQGTAQDLLRRSGIDPDEAVARVEKRLKRGARPWESAQMPFTRSARRVLGRALEESTALAHDHVGCEHLLLGLVAEKKGIAAETLRELGLDAERLRTLLGTPPAAPARPDDAARSRAWFESYTPPSKKLGGFARLEAQRLRHDCIGNEHLLLGLLAMGDNTGLRILVESGIDPQLLRREIEARLTPGDAPIPDGQLPFTPRAKQVLEWTVEETKRLGTDSIGPEHLLLGLLRDEHSMTGEVLRSLGLDLETARARVRRPPGPPTINDELRALRDEVAALTQRVQALEQRLR